MTPPRNTALLAEYWSESQLHRRGWLDEWVTRTLPAPRRVSTIRPAPLVLGVEKDLIVSLSLRTSATFPVWAKADVLLEEKRKWFRAATAASRTKDAFGQFLVTVYPQDAPLALLCDALLSTRGWEADASYAPVGLVGARLADAVSDRRHRGAMLAFLRHHMGDYSVEVATGKFGHSANRLRYDALFERCYPFLRPSPRVA